VLLDVRPGTKLGLSVTDLQAWGGHASIGGLRIVQTLNDRFSIDAGIAASDSGNITIRQRKTAIVNYKALEAKNLVLGMGVDTYDMRGGGKATSLLTQAVYYVPKMPVVVQADYTATESKFNERRGHRIGAAVTYGKVHDWTVSLRADSGRVNYELVTRPGSIADYDSRSQGVGMNYWLSKDLGISANFGRVSNRYFKREEIRVGTFFSF
jgi:YaiO family outer membrane protein